MVGHLSGWGKFSTILETSGGESLRPVNCETGKPSENALVTNGLALSEGLIYKKEAHVKILSPVKLCFMVDGQKREVTLIMEDKKEGCEKFGWCSQFLSEEDCQQSCHQITRQRCR